MAEIPDFSEVPLKEIFAHASYEDLFPEEISPEQRKRMRCLLWKKTGDLLMEQRELECQVAEQQEELRGLYEANAVMLAENEAIAARKEALEAEISELHKNTRVDTLTGLLNSAGFEDKYSRWLEANKGNPNKKMIFVYIDVNDLKKINDTYSHSAGDAAIAHFADALRYITRGGDIVARMHGDEFVLGLPCARSDESEVGVEEANDGSIFDVEGYVRNLPTRISEQLQTSINDDNVPEGAVKSLIETLRQIKFSYGANICTGDDFDKPVTDLLHVADERMYIHKHHTKAKNSDTTEYVI